MNWFLIIYVIWSQGGDAGIVQGYVAPSQRIEIAMPSQDMCEQIAKLNRFRSAECWAKLENKTDETIHFDADGLTCYERQAVGGTCPAVKK